MKLIALAIAALASFAGCGADLVPVERGCTEIGCADGLNVDLSSGPWKAGAYVFELKGDGKTQRCEGTLPLPSCDVPGLVCTGDLEAQVSVSGCALPAGQQGFGPIQLREGPAKVSVRITRDGATIADATMTPTYKTSRPNGPTCEPECRQASDGVFVGP